jgi:predicted dehydrogenase
MNAREAESMVEAARRSGRVLIEAFHYRFHPLFIRVLELVRDGVIGRIETLEARFNVPIRYSESELRYRPELGGGAMMDLGCYPLHWVRSVMNSEPHVLSARAIRHESGVDLGMSAELEFPGSVRASIGSAMGGDIPDKLDAVLALHGSSGELIVENPLSPHTGHSLRLETTGSRRVEELDGKSTYCHQLEHVVAVLRNDQAAITGGDDAIATMRVMDAIYDAAGMR